MFWSSFTLMYAMNSEENAEHVSSQKLKVFHELKDVFNEFESLLIEGVRQDKKSFNEFIRLLIDGVRQNKGFLLVSSQVDEAIAAARIAINYAEDNVIQRLGVELFLSLLAHNKGVVAAGKTAQAAILSNNYRKQKLGLLLFTELVKQKKAIKEAVETARAAIYYVNESNSDLELKIRRLGFDLFALLVNQQEGIAEAIAAASHYMVTDPASLSLKRARYILDQELGFDLFILLIKQKQGIKEAVAAAQLASQGDIYSQFKLLPQYSDDNEALDRSLGLRLFIELVKQRDGINEAIEAAIAIIPLSSGRKYEELYYAFKLLIELVKQKEGINKAIMAVSSISYNNTVDSFKR